MNKEKAVIFCAFTADHLINSLYYSTKVDWKNYKKILVWQQFLACEVDLKLFDDYFDELIEVQKMPVNKFKRQVHRAKYFGRCFPFSDVYKKLCSYECKVIFYFSDQQSLTLNILEYFCKNDTKSILIEEGLGTYYLPDSSEYRKTDIIEKLLGIKTCDYIGQTNKADYIIVRKPELFPTVKKGKAQIIKKNYVYFDEHWIETIGLFHTSIGTTFGSKTVLWLSGPLTENGISEKDEVDLLDGISDIYEDYNFLIKLHPAEKIGKYSSVLKKKNVSILEMDKMFWLPVELVVKNIKPVACFSIISSSLGNIMDINPDMKFVYLYRLLNKPEYDGLIYEMYKEKHNVLFPSDISEIEAVFEYDSLVKDSGIKVNENQDIIFISDNVV